MQLKTTHNRKILSKDFSLVFQKSDKPLQVVVSKKVAKKAIDRNRIRRIFKEALRQLDTEKVHLKVIVRENIAGLKSNQLADKIKLLLKNEK